MFGISLFNYCNSEIEVDNYVFKDECIFEFVLFKGGFIIAKRNKKPLPLDFYNPTEDKVEKGLGYRREVKKYLFNYALFTYQSSIIKNFKL